MNANERPITIFAGKVILSRVDVFFEEKVKRFPSENENKNTRIAAEKSINIRVDYLLLAKTIIFPSFNGTCIVGINLDKKVGKERTFSAILAMCCKLNQFVVVFKSEIVQPHCDKSLFSVVGL